MDHLSLIVTLFTCVLKAPCWYLGQNTRILTLVFQGFLRPSSPIMGLCLKLAFNASF